MFQPIKCENLRITRKHRSLQRSYTLNESTLKLLSAHGILVYRSLIIWSGRIILRTLYPKPIECLVSYEDINCSKDVFCDIQKTLYISLIRSHLIYASQVWSPCFRGSIYLIWCEFGKSTKKGYAFHPSWIWTRIQVPSHSIKVITPALLPRISWPPFSLPLYKWRNTSRHIKICTIFTL
jgi:hypothetical protein